MRRLDTRVHRRSRSHVARNKSRATIEIERDGPPGRNLTATKRRTSRHVATRECHLVRCWRRLRLGDSGARREDFAPACACSACQPTFGSQHSLRRLAPTRFFTKHAACRPAHSLLTVCPAIATSPNVGEFADAKYRTEWREHKKV